jgi:hypothetical protein
MRGQNRSEPIESGSDRLAPVLSILLAAAEPSKTPFYFVGGALAVWAVVLSAIGLTRPSFPENLGGERGVILLSLVLVVATVAVAVATSK